MIESIAGIIKSLSEHIGSGGDFDLKEVRVSFSAPNPRKASTETLTINKNKMYEANFQWVKYGILFTKGNDFFVYQVSLNPWGSKQDNAQIIKSDSELKLYKQEPVDIKPIDVEHAFPSILRGPNLHPGGGVRINYINTDQSDKGNQYSGLEFKRYFDNDYFVVITKSKTMENPYGTPIGVIGESDDK